MTYRSDMTTNESFGAAPAAAPARATNAYVPPPSAKRKAPTANGASAASLVEVPDAMVPEPIPIFKVGYRKVRSCRIDFPDRSVRLTTPKLVALETIAENQELLLQFTDASVAQKQPVKAVREVMGIMRDIIPFMVPDDGDRAFLIERFDDEKVEEVDLITAVLQTFTYLMGTITGSKAVAGATKPKAPEEPEAEPVAAAPDEAEEFANATAAAEPEPVEEATLPDHATNPQSNAYPHVPLDLPAHEATPAPAEEERAA